MTRLRRDDKLIVEIVRNHWTVNKANSWDKNYDDDSLEVKDSRVRVVLQVRIFPDAVHLQVEFRSGRGANSYFVEDGQYTEGDGIRPMFLYPSTDHWGEFDPSNTPPVR